MADDSGQDKTEEPTARRLDKAREEGQVARSKELSAVSTLIVGMLMLMAMGPFMLGKLQAAFRLIEQVGRLDLDHDWPLTRLLGAGLGLGFQAALPVLAVLMFVALAAGAGLGGLTFAAKPLTPDLKKLDPLKGLGRMFSANSLVELGKATLKFLLVSTVTASVLYGLMDAFMSVGRADPYASAGATMLLAFGGAAVVASGLLLVVAIDVPWQLYQHNKKLKMTRQELKDEYKETEGRPEVKARIREAQRAVANRRMLDAVAGADVVVTNPEHYAVALRYRAGTDQAPVIVAKGVDAMAMRIREVARARGVEQLPLPPLARALHRHGRLDEAVPRALFVAVAQVLAYVQQLREYRRGRGELPSRLRAVEIPEGFEVESGS